MVRLRNTTNPEYARKGLTAEQAQQVLRLQKYRCAVCGDPLTGQWAADHDHELARRHGHPEGQSCVREFRSMTCRSCNLMLGYAKDDPDILRAAIDYLTQWYSQTYGSPDKPQQTTPR